MLIGVIYQHTKLAPCTEEQARALVLSNRACFLSRDVIRLTVSPSMVRWEPTRGFRPGWPLQRGSRFIIHADVIGKVRTLARRHRCNAAQLRKYVEDLTTNNGRFLRYDVDGAMYYGTCAGLTFKVRAGTGTVVDVYKAA